MGVTLALVLLCLSTLAVVRGHAGQRSGSRQKPFLAVDPGPRGGPPGAGQFIVGLTPNQTAAAQLGQTQFQSAHSVTGTQEIGLGPRFDSNSCSSCHSTPAPGGSAPATNPLFGVYQLNGAQNSMPFFETSSGPPLTARFPFQSDLVTPDGNVHQLFVITGRTDAGNCGIAQPDFVTAAAQGNLSFRQPTPTFGVGLVELLLDSDILANMNANLSKKQVRGISGHPNIAEDGSIARLGWKAQDRSALIMAFEQFNVEMGVTSEDLPNELDETSGCVLNPVPEDHTNFSAKTLPTFPGDSERLAIFMRFLDRPTPAAPTPSTSNGQVQFKQYRMRAVSHAIVHHAPCLCEGIEQNQGQPVFRLAGSSYGALSG